ncbi:MAG TPA: glycosyltransferase family 1 protein [Fervidobacterium sp.]|nr:glycosyltransferase family 1 protein [Fervidobacterium sp.]
MSKAVINTRNLSSTLSGVQRYTIELLDRLQGKLCPIAPEIPLHGFLGHAWEQMILPVRLKGNLLFSPSNTGPLMVERQVVTIHDITPLDHPEWLNPRFARWYQFLIPRLVHKAQKVIAVSEFTKSRICDVASLKPNKVVVIYNGIDERFRPKSFEEIDQVKDALGIADFRYILTVATIEPRKNLQRLLEAWSVACSNLPQDVWLVVAGAKGKDIIFKNTSLKKLPPRVYMPGHVPDEHLPALYSGAIALVYVSLYEGFGLPPLEAMACGTPVLTSNVASIPEVVGDAALTVDPYDIDAIAEGIKRLVEDDNLRRELSQKGLARAKLFHWDRTAELTWNVLEGAMSL